MKENKKIKILTKAEGKYKTYSLNELEKEAKLIEDKIGSLGYRKFDFNFRFLDEWEKLSNTDVLDHAGRMIVVPVISALVVGAAAAQLLPPDVLNRGFATFNLTFAGGIMGIANAVTSVYKPVTLPIARAYDKFLGDKIEVLGKKKLMVDELMETKRIQHERDMRVRAEMFETYVRHEFNNPKYHPIEVYRAVDIVNNKRTNPPEENEENSK